MERLFRQILVCGVISMLLIGIIPRMSALAQQDEGQVTIVFDFSHDQLFSPLKRNFTEAVDFLITHPEYFVRILEKGELTAENLTRSHILVISNPGKNYTGTELEVILNYVAQGGSLFLLGDYQVVDRAIGNPIALNDILQALHVTGIGFTTISTDNETQGDAIIDPVNSQALSYNVMVNTTYINPDLPRAVIGAGITSLIIAGGSLTSSSGDLIISTGAETSQAVSITGVTIQNQPGWLAAFQNQNAHIVLCTSTTMFTNTLCAATNTSWFESYDNALLWSNIFRWMAIPLIQDPTPIMIFFVGTVLFVGIVLFGYSLLLKRRGR